MLPVEGTNFFLKCLSILSLFEFDIASVQIVLENTDVVYSDIAKAQQIQPPDSYIMLWTYCI